MKKDLNFSCHFSIESSLYLLHPKILKKWVNYIYSISNFLNIIILQAVIVYCIWNVVVVYSHNWISKRDSKGLTQSWCAVQFTMSSHDLSYHLIKSIFNAGRFFVVLHYRSYFSTWCRKTWAKGRIISNWFRQN